MVLFPSFLFGEGEKMVMGTDFGRARAAKLLCIMDESQHGSDLPSRSRGLSLPGPGAGGSKIM